MSNQNDRTSLLDGQRGGVPTASLPGYQQGTGEYGPIYQDESDSPKKRLLQLAFMILVIVFVLITLILSIYQSVVAHSGLHAMMGITLAGLLLLHIILIRFVRNRDIETNKIWFLYAMGLAIILESIFTNILLFVK